MSRHSPPVDILTATITATDAPTLVLAPTNMLAISENFSLWIANDGLFDVEVSFEPSPDGTNENAEIAPIVVPPGKAAMLQRARETFRWWAVVVTCMTAGQTCEVRRGITISRD
jgi:hypothetical protein